MYIRQFRTAFGHCQLPYDHIECLIVESLISDHGIDFPSETCVCYVTRRAIYCLYRSSLSATYAANSAETLSIRSAFSSCRATLCGLLCPRRRVSRHQSPITRPTCIAFNSGSCCTCNLRKPPHHEAVKSHPEAEHHARLNKI